MKKNKLFILSSILIIITLFTTAATLEMCGISVDIGETAQEVQEIEEVQREVSEEVREDETTEEVEYTESESEIADEGSPGDEMVEEEISEDSAIEEANEGPETESEATEADTEDDSDIHGPGLVYSFLKAAPEALWSTGYGHVGFGATLDESYGFCTFVHDTPLEDGSVYPVVLETRPESVIGGYITGRFPNISDTISIPSGARFQAKVGFLEGATETEGVNLRITFNDGSNTYDFPSYSGLYPEYDGVLDTLDYDLSPMAGETVQVFFITRSDGNPIQDEFVWVDPKIVIE